MATRKELDWALRHVGSRLFAPRRLFLRISLTLLSCGLGLGPLPATGDDESHAVKDVSRQVKLDGPGIAGPTVSDVVQVLDSSGEPCAYLMDVASVVCADTLCETVTVRLHFDPLGGYERYELPFGGNLTKAGGKPFSPADHERLHQILSDPYSPLKSVGLNEITAPQSSAAGGVDAVSRPTLLSKRSAVVVGAAYTCCTLWHWSHGEVGNVIREMTVRACDKQDLLRYLHSDKDTYVAFAAEQLRTQGVFEPETIVAVVLVMRHGSVQMINPALDYLAEASRKTGVDHFFCCRDDEYLVRDSIKRTRFLEAIRKTDQKLPPGYLDRFVGWLKRADSYYEVHLLLTLRERENASSEEAVDEAIWLLESDDDLVVRRSYRYLKAVKLNDSQQQKLEAFERRRPD